MCGCLEFFIASVENAENELTQFQYDLFGNKVHVVKPKGTAYSQVSTYDERNRLVNIEDAQGNNTRFEYDANGNVRHQYQPAANDAGEIIKTGTQESLVKRQMELPLKVMTYNSGLKALTRAGLLILEKYQVLEMNDFTKRQFLTVIDNAIA